MDHLDEVIRDFRNLRRICLRLGDFTARFIGIISRAANGVMAHIVSRAISAGKGCRRCFIAGD